MSFEAILLAGALLYGLYAIAVSVPALAVKPPWLIVLDAAIKAWEKQPTIEACRAECDRQCAAQQAAYERVVAAYRSAPNALPHPPKPIATEQAINNLEKSFHG